MYVLKNIQKLHIPPLNIELDIFLSKLLKFTNLLILLFFILQLIFKFININFTFY